MYTTIYANAHVYVCIYAVLCMYLLIYIITKIINIYNIYGKTWGVE